MNAIRKTLALACAVSVLGLGTAFAQTDPNATPAPGGAMMAAPAGGDMAADQKPMPKKKMMKHKKMSHKKMMMKKKAM